MCVSQAIKNHSREIANQASPTAFRFLCMPLAIVTIDGWGLSNKARCELLPKKSKVILYLPSCTLLTRQSASVLKVGMLCGL